MRDRSVKIVLVSLCLAMAAALTAYRRLVDKRRSNIPRSSRNRLAGEKPYKLSALRIFSDALQRVRDSYVDPSRIRPDKMLIAAIEAVQREVAEVIVKKSKNGRRVTVKVDIYQRTFDISKVRSLHVLYKRMKEIIGFVERHLDRETDIREVEYACINGALSTLDPHSVLWNPQTYNEMKVGTRGSFGGLGIVISIRGGVLTVISPIDDTPASRAGIRAGDRVVRIESESTINMTLNEAVNRLRGEPGTYVTIYVERDGVAKPLRFRLKRAIIKIKTTESRVLMGNVGYVRIKHFSRTTAKELEQHLVALKKKNVVGIVVDLYNNPGGLLEQAIRTADILLRRGVIVTTVSNAGKQREEKKASSWSLVGELPLVALVNAGSASASEIVAGALKNQGRAVIIGETTFGKGSVQVLYDNRDGSALKLTIAQYLTPGDVSIQSTGIAPDIRMVPVSVGKSRIFFFGSGRQRREIDLAAHLDPYKDKSKGGRPVAVLRYLETRSKPGGGKPKTGDDSADDSGNAADRAVIKLARDLILQGFGNKRRRMLSLAKEFLSQRRLEEENHIVTALSKRKVDWSVAPASGVPMLEAEVRTDKPGAAYRAGEKVGITVAVTNLGLGPAYRVRAITRAPSSSFRDLEFFFGKVGPGETRTYRTEVVIPKDTHDSILPVRLKFAEEYGHQPPEQKLRLVIQGRRRAIFAAHYQFLDQEGGNGDGLAQPGEKLKMQLTVRNIGNGMSGETVATLKNLSGADVFVRRGRLTLGKLKPGQEATGVFTFDLRRAASINLAKFELSIFDNDLHEGVRDKVFLPLTRKGKTPVDESGWAIIRSDDVPLRAGADRGAALVGTATTGMSFKVSGRAGGFYRVMTAPGRPAFVSVAAVERATEAPRPTPTGAFRPRFQLSPPMIILGRYPLSTSAHEITITGTAFDNGRVKDVFVEVTNPKGKIFSRKVYYQSNRNGNNMRVLSFRARVPLETGLNYITAVARETKEVRSHKVLVVLRDPSVPAYSALPRPKKNKR